MKKETKEMPKLENAAAENAINPETVTHPAEVEAHNLRNALADERIKTDALARRCIRLAEALDAAILAEDNRVESNMFAIINGNCDNHRALATAENNRREKRKKEMAALDKACKRNAVDLTLAATIAIAAMILGLTGLVHIAIAALFSIAGLIFFGWSLNDCVYLLGRCSK